ncbi:hypothetical protein ABE237_16080 [Brevibacillus formosus]|uniref:hypothetical protein n=1 Tax=Brevibacillus formosus TaxID=54913 RepID=UPI0018CFAAFA|nr:hypothetical protein [Brevibacillus formosus]MBG9944223.1 hypothetical protein [Brevibacillus formosus]
MDVLNRYERRVYSQNGEDGIIEEIFSRIGTTSNRYCVEFGVGDGSECMIKNLVTQHGWSGLAMEGDLNCCHKMAADYAAYPQVKIKNELTTKENIARLLEENGVPKEFDLLSIDIDGNDYWVWQALSAYTPRLVVIEYNASFPPPQKMVIVYQPDFKWGGTTYFGASLSSLAILGTRLGYALVGTDSKGVNAFFVRRDLLLQSGFPERTPEQAYHPPRYGAVDGGHPHQYGPYLEI